MSPGNMWEKEPKKDMLHDNTVGTGADAGRELINNSAEQRPAGVNCWLNCTALMGQQAGSWEAELTQGVLMH